MDTPYRREPGYAERYRDRRFSLAHGPRTDRRERAAIRSLLQSAAIPPGIWLDAPSGAGRLSDELPGSVVRLDRDPQMLLAAGPSAQRVCATISALPFVNRSFAGVLCCRLLQHIASAAERRTILCELARVSRGPILISFFDCCSLQHARRVLRRAMGKTRSGREAIQRRALLADVRAAGLQPVRFYAVSRFIAEQTFLLCSPQPN
ncbi:MAG: methyltransferase domain-containing protein [Planctomycetes bacterium]|nr:methyltransferase domain-containing protein [Planctomycetota bacterium]